MNEIYITSDQIEEIERHYNQSENNSSQKQNINVTSRKINYPEEVQLDRNESTKKSQCLCTCCHQHNFQSKDCVIFVKKNYNFSNKLVADELKQRCREHFNKEFICKPCHRKLKEENFKQKCSDIDEQTEVKTCFFCGNIPCQTYRVFNKEEYRKSQFIEQIEFNETAIEVGSIICSTCHNSLLSECIVDCTICGDAVQRKITYVYDNKKYKTWSQNKQKQVKKNSGEIKRYICIKCHSKIQPQFQCVSL